MPPSSGDDRFPARGPPPSGLPSVPGRVLSTPRGGERLVGGVYRLDRRIGAGAMGVVYAAHHVLTEAEVALKLLHPHVTKATLNLARFEREVSVAARVGHDGIVKVYDAGMDPEDGTLFVAMELLRGCSLEAWLRQPGMTLLDVVEMHLEMCEPLAAAHEKGIVHRDLKPDNVFIHGEDDEHKVKLLDFGIARDLAANGLTATNAGLGTPHYMAPEQATDARGVTQRADVWSLGVMLYWYLAGKLPFDGDGPFDTVLKAMTSPHEPLSADCAPPELIRLVDECLTKAPEERPLNAAVLRNRLLAIAQTATLGSELPEPAPRPQEEVVPSLEGSQEMAIGEAAKSLLERARAAARSEPIPTPVPRAVEPPPPWPGSGDRGPEAPTETPASAQALPSAVSFRTADPTPSVIAARVEDSLTAPEPPPRRRRSPIAWALLAALAVVSLAWLTVGVGPALKTAPIPTRTMASPPLVGASGRSPDEVSPSGKRPNIGQEGAEPATAGGRAEPATARRRAEPSTARRRAEPATARRRAEPSTARGRAEPSTARRRAEPDPRAAPGGKQDLAEAAQDPGPPPPEAPPAKAPAALAAQPKPSAPGPDPTEPPATKTPRPDSAEGGASPRAAAPKKTTPNPKSKKKKDPEANDFVTF